MNKLKPTHRTREWVIVFAIALAVITYMDRVCISQASGNIQRDLNLTKEDMSLVFAAFTLAYGLFEIPCGWLGDKFGPRQMLIRVVLMWSVFTAATGWAWNWTSMIVCRFLFGAGEAGCFPNITKAFTIWLPKNERVRVQGLMWLSARWGGALTPLVVVWVLQFVSWRWAFGMFGTLGVVWAVVFYRWFRDDPREHPSMTPEELALLDGAEHNAPGRDGVPWKRLLTSPNIWLLWLPFFCMNYGWYFYITWLPTYLREARGVSLTKGAMLAGLPLLIGGRFAGTLSGSMNMMGQVGGTLCPIAVAQILKYTNNNWVIAFWVAATVYAIGAVCWIFIDPVTPLDEPLTELAWSLHN